MNLNYVIYRTVHATVRSKLSSTPYLHKNLWVRRLISSEIGSHFRTCYFVPGKGAKYCDEYICLSVCLSVRSHNLKTAHPNFTIFCAWHLWSWLGRSVLWRSCDTYVLPVLWMTSCFHITALWRVICIPKRRSNTTSKTAEISTKFCSTIKVIRGDRRDVSGCVLRTEPTWSYWTELKCSDTLSGVLPCVRFSLKLLNRVWTPVFSFNYSNLNPSST